jgi:hypothetical protein
MAIEVTCACGKRLRVAEEHAGQQGACPVCGRLFTLPAPEDATVARRSISPAEEMRALAEAVGPPEPGAPTAEEIIDNAQPTGAGVTLWEEIGRQVPLARPTYRLYSPGGVALATFLGGPLGGFLVLALNYRALHKRRAFWLTAGSALLICSLLCILLLRLPREGPNLCVGVVCLMVMYVMARALQGENFDYHVRTGGRQVSNWKAAGLGVLGAVLFIGLILLCSFTFDAARGKGWWRRVEFGRGHEVYYVRGATEAEARALGQFLQGAGYFDSRRAVTVQLAREGEAFVVSFVVRENAWNNPQVITWAGDFASKLSEEVFGGKPVKIQLCDEDLSPHRTVE